jgi:ubiquitin-protein ligase
LRDPSVPQYVFDAFLDSKFPFNNPQILCRTAFTDPDLSDERDLFADIIKSDWKVATKLFQIVQQIPVFI